ncbi:MAG: hypothetical protein WCB18_01025 [Thermoplasmata archaeon]
MNFTFQHYLSCSHLLEYSLNGTVAEQGGNPQHFVFGVGAPLVEEWEDYSSPDGRVSVQSFSLGLNVTLAVVP